MKSAKHIGDVPAGIQLRADDVLEFHAARVLLVFLLCGTAGRIDSLTKLAKLDFFVRYPDFFAEVCRHLGVAAQTRVGSTESAMVRHYYGPWDQRYYQLLAYLEGHGLIEARPKGSAFDLILTTTGRDTANRLRNDKVFESLCNHMRNVKKVLGRKSGSAIKNLIYKTFDEDIARRPLGESITGVS
jgi:hypothetical protein